MITSEEAERRGQFYDNQGNTYLFDLDYDSDEFTVDAARYGNVSHFVNHSVRPCFIYWEFGDYCTCARNAFYYCKHFLTVFTAFSGVFYLIPEQLTQLDDIINRMQYSDFLVVELPAKN